MQEIKDTVKCTSIIDAIKSGGIDKIYVEDAGTGFHNTFSAVTDGVDDMITEDGFTLKTEDNHNVITGHHQTQIRLCSQHFRHFD